MQVWQININAGYTTTVYDPKISAS